MKADISIRNHGFIYKPYQVQEAWPRKKMWFGTAKHLVESGIGFCSSVRTEGYFSRYSNDFIVTSNLESYGKSRQGAWSALPAITLRPTFLRTSHKYFPCLENTPSRFVCSKWYIVYRQEVQTVNNQFNTNTRINMYNTSGRVDLRLFVSTTPWPELCLWPHAP